MGPLTEAAARGTLTEVQRNILWVEFALDALDLLADGEEHLGELAQPLRSALAAAEDILEAAAFEERAAELAGARNVDELREVAHDLNCAA